MTTLIPALISVIRPARRFREFCVFSCMVLAGAGAAHASDASAATAAAEADHAMVVDAAWARATAPGIATGAIYLTITNPGDVQDALLSASSPVAASVELHRHVMKADGSMAMVRVEKLALPAHGSVTCAPGGYHLMLFNLAQPLVAGTRIPVSLVFAQAGTVTTTALVEDIAATGYDAAPGAPVPTASAAAPAGRP